MQYVSFAINEIMIIMFSLSFFSKLLSFNNFIFHLHSYKVVPRELGGFSASIILMMELFIIIGFAFGNNVMLANSLTILTLLMFTAVLKRKKDSSSCSCFGDISWLNKLPLVRNMILIFLAAINLFILPQETMYMQKAVAVCTFLCIGGYIFIKKYMDTIHLKKMIVEVNRMTSENQVNNREIIFLDYSQINLSEIEQFLLDYPTKLIIILRAPTWFVKIKEQTWNQHIVLNANKLSELGKQANEKPKIILCKHKKIKVFSEITEYMRSQIAKEQKLIYPM